MFKELKDEVAIDDNKNKVIKSNTTVTNENIKDYY